MTFENNNIVDVAGMCSVFKALKSFDKLESLNFRCNKNFNDDVVRALCEGIQLKKELRVSIFFSFLSQISIFTLQTVDLGENDISDTGI